MKVLSDVLVLSAFEYKFPGNVGIERVYLKQHESTLILSKSTGMSTHSDSIFDPLAFYLEIVKNVFCLVKMCKKGQNVQKAIKEVD